MSRLLGPILLFFGYVLVYAGIAHGGVFATDPWNGIFADAYTDINLTGPGPGATSTSTTPASSGSNSGAGASAGSSGGVQRHTVTGPTTPRKRPVNNRPGAGGIGGASNSNFGGLVPGSLTGPDQYTQGGGYLGGSPSGF